MRRHGRGDVADGVVVDGVDLSAVKTRAGDLAQDQLAKVLETGLGYNAATGVLKLPAASIAAFVAGT